MNVLNGVASSLYHCFFKLFMQYIKDLFDSFLPIGSKTPQDGSTNKNSFCPKSKCFEDVCASAYSTVKVNLNILTFASKNNFLKDFNSSGCSIQLASSMVRYKDSICTMFESYNSIFSTHYSFGDNWQSTESFNFRNYFPTNILFFMILYKLCKA